MCLKRHKLEVYKILPIHLIEMIFGVGLCFFGGRGPKSAISWDGNSGLWKGVYFASIAAFEAFRNFGGQLLMDVRRACYMSQSFRVSVSGTH